MARSQRQAKRDLAVRNVSVSLLLLGALGMLYAFIGPSTGDAGLFRHGVNGVSGLLFGLSFGCFGIYVNMGSNKGSLKGSNKGFSLSSVLINVMFIALTCLGLFIALTTLSDVAGDVQDGPQGVRVASYEEALDRNGSGRAPSFTPDEYEVDLFEHVGDSTPVAHISVKRGDWPRVLSELTSAEAGSTVLYYPRTQVFLGVEED